MRKKLIFGLQGMHDIASVLLLVLNDERKAYFVLERLCLFHIRDACAKDLGEIKSVLYLLFPLLRLVDVQVYDFILRSHRDADLTMHPVFALPWILTLYSHTLDQLATIARLMDFFIVSHPLMPLYFAAQVYTRNNCSRFPTTTHKRNDCEKRKHRS